MSSLEKQNNEYEGKIINCPKCGSEVQNNVYKCDCGFVISPLDDAVKQICNAIFEPKRKKLLKWQKNVFVFIIGPMLYMAVRNLVELIKSWNGGTLEPRLIPILTKTMMSKLPWTEGSEMFKVLGASFSFIATAAFIPLFLFLIFKMVNWFHYHSRKHTS